MSLAEEISFDKEGNVERFPLFHKLFLSITIILLAILSFGIGRLSVVGKRDSVRIEYDGVNQTANILNAVIPAPRSFSESEVVGSKNGTKYHYPHCPGAKQIKEENKLTFNSPKEAESAGYTLATNCSP